MFYEDQLLDFWTNINVENLIDIRLTPSNIAYTIYISKRQIDLGKSDYDILSHEAKVKLNNLLSPFFT